nr:MAG TPA: hypothetical protein [Caudoviricetes sp.]
MRTVIAVDLNTMRELADEEVRVRAEKIDWCEAAYREEAVRRVEERRETQQMIEVWEARRLILKAEDGNRLLEVTEKNTIGYDRALTIVSEWMNHPANRDRLPKANR